MHSHPRTRIWRGCERAGCRH